MTGERLDRWCTPSMAFNIPAALHHGFTQNLH